jgi:hypothetical protein
MVAGTELEAGPAFSSSPEALLGLRLPVAEGMVVNCEYRFISSTFWVSIGIAGGDY